MKLRKINRAIHRDLGYFFTGMIIIYAFSGIALNHRNDWNPNYSITARTLTIDVPESINSNEEQAIKEILLQIDEEDSYIVVNLNSGKSFYEELKKRPFFFEVNFLHYNPGNAWKWFSDIFSIALILLGISGLFILKGKNGILRRGAWLTIAGIIVPLILLFMYL